MKSTSQTVITGSARIFNVRSTRPDSQSVFAEFSKHATRDDVHDRESEMKFTAVSSAGDAARILVQRLFCNV